MDKKQVLDALSKLRKEAKKRNFRQSVDYSVVLKEVDLKNPENRIDEFLILKHPIGKKVKVCALVDKELVTQAREVCDKVITKDEFSNWAGKKKEIKKLANEFDYFIAQANIMTDIAATFGKVFGPKGKMPNPKSGCIVTPKSDLKALVERLQRMVRIQAKKQPVVSTMVGVEDMKDEDLADNILQVYDFVVKKLPRGEQQVKKTYVKFTMSKPVMI
ncbi:MAG: 50S ribosomal protein L1 [Nanoarchaeota archaeon]|nr:50S ribosomal protein L1 [Nanoarchaeota archaeon]